MKKPETQNTSPALDAALTFVPETRARIARELRRMADAGGCEYANFSDVSLWTKSIWLAAAELIEKI